MLACAVAYWALGFDSMLSWASDFVPLLLAVVGIAVSVKRLRDEHQAAVIAVIVIVGIMGTVVCTYRVHTTKIPTRKKSAVSGSGWTRGRSKIRNYLHHY